MSVGARRCRGYVSLWVDAWGTGRARVYVRLMDNSPGEGLAGTYEYQRTAGQGAAALEISPNAALPGDGADRDPVFADGVHEAAVVCRSVQPPEHASRSGAA